MEVKETAVRLTPYFVVFLFVSCLGYVAWHMVWPRVVVAPTVTVIEAPQGTMGSQPVSSRSQTTNATTTVWFVGDVMLSRQVGAFAVERGFDFPFQNVRDAFVGNYVVGNFESCLSTTTTFDAGQSMRFPVSVTFVPAVVLAGFTHLSLANNHALDCGPVDYRTTHHQFNQAGIDTFGHPVVAGDISVTYQTVGERQVALIGLHTLFNEPTDSELAYVMASTTAHSDLQIIYVHWGNEYEPLPSSQQKTLARKLIREGADLIVGHHPHVVQSIELVDGVVVFYSLGNFVFDQYFSRAVQEGLALTLELNEVPSVGLRPVTSVGSKTQPRFMSEQESVAFLTELSGRSSETLAPFIASGTIPLQL